MDAMRAIREGGAGELKCIGGSHCLGLGAFFLSQSDGAMAVSGWACNSASAGITTSFANCDNRFSVQTGLDFAIHNRHSMSTKHTEPSKTYP